MITCWWREKNIFLQPMRRGNSVFVIPVAALDTPLEVVADTVAMSKPHEIEYTITIKGDTLQALE